MQIEHYFNSTFSLQKAINSCSGLFSANNLGGYFWLGNKPESRYQGWFFYFHNKIFKIIENIEPLGRGEVSLLRNNFFNLERQRGDFKEKFFVPRFKNVLAYQVSQKTNIQITLDFKEAYANGKEYSDYEIVSYGEVLIVKFTSFYLAVKSDGYCQLKKEWLKRSYCFDQARNSPPFERKVFCGFIVNSATKVVFALAPDKKSAVQQALSFFKRSAFLELQQKNICQARQKNIIFDLNEKEMAELCAENSLSNLLVFKNSKSVAGIFAGLPWFFQFWPRDEAISLVAFNKKLRKNIFFEKILKFSLKNNFSQEEWLWLVFGLRELTFNFFEGRKIKNFLLANFKPDNQFYEGDSWMDTLQRKSPLEMQALKLRSLKIAFELTTNKQYQEAEFLLLKKVQQKFFKGGLLADSENDFTIRPNVFLAHYFYPDLLKKKQWQGCFEIALKKLWLDWGGLSTLDRNHPSFCSFSTGEDPKSYHQGDSWFFVNNLAALALFRVNSDKFSFYIKKILKASSFEILWQGVPGSHSELSSAFKLMPTGCFCQAWSCSSLLEALREIRFR